MNFSSCAVLRVLSLYAAAFGGEIYYQHYICTKKTKFPQKNAQLKSVIQDLVMVMGIPAVRMDVMEETARTECWVLEGFQAETDKMESLGIKVLQAEMDEMECLVLEVLLAEMA